MYDVTGVSEQGDYVPIMAGVAEIGRAKQHAADYSDGRGWSAVVVKYARTGRIIATYRHGTRTPA